MVKHYLSLRLVLVFMLFATALTSFTFAQNISDVELVVTGEGPTKNDATLFALRSALEQVYGTLVSSNTKILNDDLVKDEIVSISTGIVKNYTYLSEKQIDGRYFVVVKAVVTPQKLVTYAKQKGASIEFAGATFAANARLEKLNNENKRKVRRDLTLKQLELLHKSFDCVITDIEDPEHEEGDLYRVDFNLCFKFNQNASYIQELEQQKKDIKGGEYPRFNYEKVLNQIFDRIYIYDNLRTHHLKVVDNSEAEKNEEALYITSENIDHKKSALYAYDAHIGHGGFILYYEKALTDIEDKRIMSHSNKNCILQYDITGKYNNEILGYWNFQWQYVNPNVTFAKIEAYMLYSLNELDKITGIKVVIK